MELAVIVTEREDELHDAKSVCEIVTVGCSEGVSLSSTGPASGLQVKWTIVVALPGEE